MRMVKVCILSAGTANAYALVSHLRENYSKYTEIITADILPSEWVASSKLSDRHLVVPRIDENGYVEKIKKIFEENEIDWIVPLIDEDCISFPSGDENNFSYSSYSIPKKQVELFSSKLIQRSLLAKENIPCEEILYSGQHAQITRADHSEYNGLKVVIKNLMGSGSKNVKIIERTHSETISLETDQFLTEFIDSEEFTTDVFHLPGKIQTCSRIREEIKQGVCTKAKVFWSPELHEIALLLLKSYQLPICFNFQTRLKNGRHVIIDLNPRIGAGSTASRALGFDFFDATCKVILGMEDEIEFTEPDQYAKFAVVRAYHDYITKI